MWYFRNLIILGYVTHFYFYRYLLWLKQTNNIFSFLIFCPSLSERKYFIEDVGSRNGTYVSEEKLEGRTIGKKFVHFENYWSLNPPSNNPEFNFCMWHKSSARFCARYSVGMANFSSSNCILHFRLDGKYSLFCVQRLFVYLPEHQG